MNYPVLIVSATANEVSPIIKTMEERKTISPYLSTGIVAGIPIEVLIGGIGAVAQTYRLTQLLLQRSYEFALSVGIGGTFTDDISIGEVVQITIDCFADLGIDDNGTFLSLTEAGLVDPGELPFDKSRIINPSPLHLPFREVSGVTVQTVSGSKKRIDALVSLYHPQVETMENAAFFYVCRMMQIPFTSLRAISNKVEPRNRNNWQIPMAIGQVNIAVRDLLTTLPTNINDIS